MDIIDGWLREAARCPSPNRNRRPEGAEISLLVVHCISLPPGEFGTGCVREFFCNRLDWNAHPYFQTIRGRQVSAHFLIERDGALTQFVPCFDRAWHAGASAFQGREECNDFSIGAELEGTDSGDFTAPQYSALARLSRQLMRAYPAITPERIVGHEHIAPGRKTDPGPGFDWAHFRRLLRDGAACSETGQSLPPDEAGLRQDGTGLLPDGTEPSAGRGKA